MVARCGGDIERLKTASRQLVRQWDGSAQRRLQAAHAGHDLRHRARDRVCQSIWTPFGSAPSYGAQPALAEELKSIHDSIRRRRTPSMGRSLAAKQVLAAIRHHGAGWLPGGMGARALPGHPGRSRDAGKRFGPRRLRSGTGPLLGWLITAVAALFGAPFWFDALQSIVRLKGAGPSPDEKATNRAASS